MRDKWRRIVGLALLLWVFADLGLQGVCCKADASMPAPAEAANLAPAGSSQEYPGECAEGGCFCCCTHTLPTPHFELAFDSKLPLEVIAVSDQMSKGFHALVYHPPRA